MSVVIVMPSSNKGIVLEMPWDKSESDIMKIEKRTLEKQMQA